MSKQKAKDWARNCCSPQFLIAWGIPISALVLSSSAGIGLAWIWPMGLAWLGTLGLLSRSPHDLANHLLGRSLQIA